MSLFEDEGYEHEDEDEDEDDADDDSVDKDNDPGSYPAAARVLQEEYRQGHWLLMNCLSYQMLIQW